MPVLGNSQSFYQGRGLLIVCKLFADLDIEEPAPFFKATGQRHQLVKADGIVEMGHSCLGVAGGNLPAAP